MTRPVTAAQKELDPFHGHSHELAVVGGSVVGSAALHAAIVLGGLWLKKDADDDKNRTATPIEVREREKKIEPPPPPPEPPKPEPEPPKPVARVERPAPAKLAEPEPPPPDEVKKPPPRVVGLSLDSTSEGGGGPSFAVGNTREGTTEKKAVDKELVAPVGVAPIAVPTEKPPAGPNQVASRIPTMGAKIVLPKRKRPATLVYPETLKAQGIEADVTVLVVVGADGKPQSVKIAKGSGYPELDEAARNAALGEEFDPATRDGAAVSYTLSFTYRFRLEDQ